MSSSDSSSEDNASRKKKYRKQMFCKKWLEEDVFNGWLEEVKEDKYKCKCTACNKYLNCGKSELVKHSEGKLHQKQIRCVKNNNAVDVYFV